MSEAVFVVLLLVGIFLAGVYSGMLIVKLGKGPALYIDPEPRTVYMTVDPQYARKSLDEALWFEHGLLAGQEREKVLLQQLAEYQLKDDSPEPVDPEADRTGLCTVRELAAEMIKAPRISGECVCELAFTDDDGRRINFECAVTLVDGVPYARQRAPIFREGKMTFDEFWAEFDPYKTKGQELFKGHNYQTGKMVWDAASLAEREWDRAGPREIFNG